MDAAVNREPPSARLKPNSEQLEAFITTMFKHASKDRIGAVCAFSDDYNCKVFDITTKPIDDDLSRVIRAAIKLAQRAANARARVAFCLPLATFNNSSAAKNLLMLRFAGRDGSESEDERPEVSDLHLESGLAEGLAVSFDLDWNPNVGRAKLERVLGPPTVVVASGGAWSNPETGLLEPRLHLHWRLRVPARGSDLVRLREARQRLGSLVKAYPLASLVWCPLRGPGSWHRQGEPVLCRTLAINKREISLKYLRYICEMPDGLLENDLEGRGEPPEPDEALNPFEAYGQEGVQPHTRWYTPSEN